MFYLYRHSCEINGETIPFYIGIGKRERYYTSYQREYRRAFCFIKRSRTWTGFVRNKKVNVIVEILFESDSHEFIKQKEKEFIKLYGRKNQGTGTLINLTDGGDGSLGYIPTEESRRKNSLAKKGKRLPLEVRQKIALANRGKKRDPVVVDRIRLSNIGRKRSLETRIKLSEAHKGNYWPEEKRKKVSESLKKYFAVHGHPMPDYVRAKLSIAKKGKPGNRKGSSPSQETREKIRQSLLEYNRKRKQSQYGAAV